MIEIARNTLVFVKNPFANYVVQFVLKLKYSEINKIISEQLMSELINLSKQKFSSNVIEKCLEFNTNQMNEQIVHCLMSNKNQYFNLLIDNFGNYVIQKCLQVTQEPLLSVFISELKDDVEKLGQSNEFGMKIYQRLIKKYPALESDLIVNDFQPVRRN